MLGNLTLDAIPFGVPIVMYTVSVVLILGLALVAAITYYGKWGYLWNEWFTSVDHKKIGVMYIFVALVMLVRGFADAIMMRTQLAVATGGAEGYLPPEHYDQIFSAHGVIMIIFMAMPLMIGLFNIVVPLQIGARDVAFPFLNNISFWLFVVGVVLVNISLGIGNFARTGWLAYPPLSEMAYSPDVGVDYYIWALQISGVGTTLTGINFFATIIKMRAPGMTLMKMPVFTWTALCSNVLIMAAFPMLTATLALLTLDRYLGMHFFTNAGGGDPMLYVNLIWAWGHPEVYILILPAFGVFSEVIATFSRKALFGYKSMVYATVSITVLSFVVWLHHFFTMGSGANVNAFFGIATMIIAIPTGVKIFNWLFTMFRGRIEFTTPVLWTLGFIITFSLGGMTGVLMAVPGADFLLHNSLFLIAHFHNVLIGGVVFGYLAGINYWFPKAFGYTLDEGWGKTSFWCWQIGYYIAFTPLYILGFMGMTRRLNHTDNPAWTPFLEIACVGAFIVLAGILSQFIQLYVSYRKREQNRDKTGDPWNGRTLEWSTSSPPPHYNFAHLPKGETLDAHWHHKLQGTAYQPPHTYEPIHMPKNSAGGVIIGIFSFFMGFGLVWYIWWMAILGFAGIIGTLIIHSYNKDVDYYVPADEVSKIEKQRFDELAKLPPPSVDDASVINPQLAKEY